jgi:hypothetical protein
LLTGDRDAIKNTVKLKFSTGRYKINKKDVVESLSVSFQLQKKIQENAGMSEKVFGEFLNAIRFYLDLWDTKS